MTEIPDLDDRTFEPAMKKIKADLVLIDFWADWCAPCIQLGSVISKFAEANPAVQVVKVDTNVALKVAGRFGVTNLPTVVFVERKTGEIVAEARGNVTARILTDRLAQARQMLA